MPGTAATTCDELSYICTLAPKTLIVDEMGYLPLDDLGATIFFQLVSALYEPGSIVLTSNKS